MNFASRVTASSLRLFSNVHYGLREPVWLSSLSSKDVTLGYYHSLAQKRRKQLEGERKASKPLNPVPTLHVANTLPLSSREMENSSLVVLAAMGRYEARVEILKRHIMTVDNIGYEIACQTFEKIHDENRNYIWLSSLPYQVGIVTALTAAAASIPLCFYLPTVVYFNEHYVTADVPEPKDLETFLEVGSWAWNWMEPPLGQISFVLLCLQFTRYVQ